MVDQAAIARVKASGAFKFYGFSGEVFTTSSGEIVTLHQALEILDEVQRRSEDDDD